MVQTTQAASNSLLSMLIPGGMASKKGETTNAVFPYGKVRGENAQGKPKQKQNYADPLMAMAACVATQSAPPQETVQETVQAEASTDQAVGLAQTAKEPANEVVGNLEGTHNLNGEMLASMLKQLNKAQSGDEDAQAWLQALLARMPEGEEWNLEKLTQFLNENVAQVESAPYPLENTNNTDLMKMLQAMQLLVKAEEPAAETVETPKLDANAMAEADVDGELGVKAEPAKIAPQAGEADASDEKDAKADTPKPQAAKTDDAPKAALHAPAPLQAAPVAAQSVGAPAVPAQHIASQTVDALVAAVNSGKDSMSIQMKPDFLGNLSIQLTMGKEGLIAKIRTESPEVQSVIASQISELASTLRAKGVQVVSMDVVYDQLNSFHDMPKGNNNGQQSGRQGNAAHVVERIDTGLLPGEGWQDTAMVIAETMGNSVEYSA